ncbi:hypothetical protein G6F45_013290 [Rhizopus arrhizus]|nr:hypothetical protein G6F45_013290 [Rhizopus arrhizus]
MAILNKIGVNRQGFSLLLCSRLYATFVRPKFEYGLAISRLTATDLKSIENLQDRCLRLLVGGHRTSSTTIIKHITTLPSMRHRIDLLSTVSLVNLVACISYQDPSRKKSALHGSAFSSSVLRYSAQDLLSPVS